MYHCPLPILAFIAAVVELKSACPVLPLVSAQSDGPRRFNFFVIASNHFERSIMQSVCVYTKALSNTHLCQTQRPSTSHPQRHHAPASVVGPRTVRWATFLDRLDDAWTRWLHEPRPPSSTSHGAEHRTDSTDRYLVA
ncbi:hypothetical protein C8F04DRAFT_1253953 [Mycena alexandri]|uniref:Secreted protein n=1 Tax=Mycena alexandri TaxID=1745969 RepID=A0AAD6T6C0_9AGAR|nr:hypothetical protein C8F04DRAFT_1253953 [Mycena alexandri]